MENLNPSNSSCIAPRKTRNVMLDILIALAPATVAAIVLFGLKAAVIIAVCVGSALLSEFVFNILAKKEQTVGGIIIPDTAKEKPAKGVVVAVGTGKRAKDGSRMAMDVKAGDVVLFGKYSGSEVKLNGKEYMILREDDVLAVVEE